MITHLSRKLLIPFLFLIFLQCLNGSAMAQTPPPCPTTPPPVGMPFTHSDCVHLFLPGGCGVEICWCSRHIGLYDDIMITSITPDISTDCDNTAWRDIITLSNVALLQHLTGTSNPPPCTGYSRDTISSYMGTCWDLTSFGIPATHVLHLCDNGGWCHTIYTYCVDLGSLEIYPVSTSCTAGDCTDAAPGDNQPWSSGHCYQVFSQCP
jgi:hypothetical protein